MAREVFSQSVCLQHEMLDEVGNGLWGLSLSVGGGFKVQGNGGVQEGAMGEGSNEWGQI